MENQWASEPSKTMTQQQAMAPSTGSGGCFRA